MGLCLPPSLSEETLQGFKYFRLLGPLFDHLHRAATERDRAGNRQLFYDRPRSWRRPLPSSSVRRKSISREK